MRPLMKVEQLPLEYMRFPRYVKVVTPFKLWLSTTRAIGMGSGDPMESWDRGVLPPETLFIPPENNSTLVSN